MKRDRTKTSRHHRKLKSHGGKGNARNISVVPHYKHVAFHTLFGDMDTYQIANYLNDVWIDPDYHLIVRRTKEVPTPA